MNQILIENKSGKVKLTDAVTPWSVEKLTEEIGKLFGASASAAGADFGGLTNCAENAVDTLDLEINSPGGSIFDGYNIYNEIQSLRERGVVVTATVTGMAASMASVICMACDTVRMVPHARMMIHEASNTVRGNAEQLRAGADLLDGISSDIAAIYASRTGKTLEAIREMMKAETWMTAAQSVEMGFANEIFDIRAKEPTKAGMTLLARLFPGNDEVSKLEAQVAENDSLRTELTTAQLKITELTGLSAIIADKDLEITALATAKQDLTTALATATEEIAAKAAEVEAAKASAGVIASETLAAIGQPVPLPLENGEAPVDHLAVFNSLKGRERSDYYAKFNAEIREQLAK